MPDLAGKTCVVTGATSGIGEATALGLVRMGARVVIVGRSQARGQATLARLQAAGSADRVDLRLADLASLADIRRLADEILATCPRIHLLVNNAGVVNLHHRINADGFEETFAVNHLAYFALTNRLLDRLVASAPARIVNVSSEAHRFGPLDLDNLQSEGKYGAMRTYGRSKAANILFTRELARRLEGTGVTVNAVHPGAVASRLGAHNGWVGKLAMGLLKVFFQTPEKGARTSLHVATAPELDGVSGAYFARCREKQPAASACDSETAQRLWDASAQLTGTGSA
ncbi:MAG: SDR family oxidoreductase [Myxococcota bacterium]|jgi:NAD(P)-dependent dehydrogenase (short-subunit alcohol dehydrogenase family)|nr:short-chain dehydrogenase [Deltaproteobacteria bacterium]MCP4242642.1 SDR family oxidoreductase [bacterium]MDP6073400.1 SDR family oxidoreductase [Myxococcota bacterium]MDP6244841.1 SDR family oxidoreductase [Myxococcota bacterium]MDP7075592.1 SDR family oxidoreductase [Myxococcota bacterium]